MPVLKAKQPAKKMSEAEILESLGAGEDTPAVDTAVVANKPPTSAGRKKTQTATEPKDLTPAAAKATGRVRSMSAQQIESMDMLADEEAEEDEVAEPKPRGRKLAGRFIRFLCFDTQEKSVPHNKVEKTHNKNSKNTK